MDLSKWIIIPGNKPILIIAQHNAPHMRNGHRKPREIHTGLLVQDICKQTQVWGAYTTETQLDPNWHHDAPFRREMRRLIEKNGITAVIDIHGKGPSASSLIEFQPNQVFRSDYSHILPSYPVKNFVSNEQVTLSEMLDRKGIASIQIELSRKGRTPKRDEWNTVTEVLTSLITGIQTG